MPTPTAAIYCRISNDAEGRELGVLRQEEDCRRLALKLGAVVSDVFIDNDVSASTASGRPRPNFDRMMRRAARGDYTHLLAYSTSRLTRRPREWDVLIDLTKTNGTLVSTVVSGMIDLTTADGRAMARTIAAWDAAEAERTSERVRRSAQQRRQSGRWPGGRPPFGFAAVLDNDGKTSLVVSSRDADRLREVASRLLGGVSLHRATKELNADGFRTIGGRPWTDRGLRRNLLSPTITGAIADGEGLLEGNWDPILDRTTWERLGLLLRDPSRTYGPLIKNDYRVRRALAGGLTKCALCGTSLTSTTVDGTPRLICSRSRGHGCGKVAVQYPAFEDWMLRQALARLRQEQRRAAHQRNLDGSHARYQQLQADLASIDGRWERGKLAYEHGLLSVDELQDLRRRLRAEQADLAQQAALLSPRLHEGLVVHLGVNLVDWPNQSLDVQRSFFTAVVSAIWVAEWPRQLTQIVRPRLSVREAARGGYTVESQEDFEARRQAHLDRAFALRCRVEWNPTHAARTPPTAT